MKYKQSVALKLRNRFAAVIATAAAITMSSHSGHAANTVNNYIGAAGGDLTVPSNWSLGHVPTVSEDAVFPSTTATGVFNFGTGLTPGANLVVGSLDDLSSGSTITIQNQTSDTSAVTITLGGAGDQGNSVSGNAADLFYVASGATFNINGTGTGADTLTLALGQSGNFNIAGTSTITAAISGTGNLTRTGSGSLTFSGAQIDNVGTFINSGTAPTIYPTAIISTPPAGSTYINGTVGPDLTGIVQNGTSDLVLNGLGSTYTAGITIQNGIVLFSAGGFSLGNASNTILLGNGSTTSNATLNFAASVGGAGSNKSFANAITVGSKAGEGVNVISASDFSLTLTGAISLTGGDLTIAPVNTGGSSITISGGITGTGNVFVSDVANKNTNFVTLSGSDINNTGSITFNNATINGVAAGANNTGTNTISANIGSNVTQIIENSTDPLTLSGTNSFTGPTTILRGTINETGGSLSSTNLNVGAGTFNYSKSGGTQGFTTTTLTSGATINNTIAGSTLNLGTVNRTIGTAVDFGITGTVNIVNANTGTTILGGWATTGGGANWAVSAGDGVNLGPITALTTYTPDTWAPGNDTTVTLASNTVTDSTTNSLRFNSNAADTVTLAGTNVITTGGILVTPTVGAFASTIGGTGTLAGSASGELIVNQWDTNAAGTLTISAPIVNNGGATALTKAGPGKLILSSTANTYTGGTYVIGGTLSVTADGNLGGAGTITLNGGTLFYGASSGSLTLSSGHLLSIGNSGGALGTSSGNNSAVGFVLGPQPDDRQRHPHDHGWWEPKRSANHQGCAEHLYGQYRRHQRAASARHDE